MTANPNQVASDGSDTDGADSTAQREAEAQIRRILNQENGWALEPETVRLADGVTVQIDGLDRVRNVAVEIVARIGDRSATRDKKIATDALKLHLLSKVVVPGCSMYIAGCDASFLGQFQVGKSRKWQAFALQHLGVKTIVVELDPEARRKIEAAQARQAKSNAQKAKPIVNIEALPPHLRKYVTQP
jgi:hypothetical protein